MLAFLRRGRGPIYPLRDAGRGSLATGTKGLGDGRRAAMARCIGCLPTRTQIYMNIRIHIHIHIHIQSHTPIHIHMLYIPICKQVGHAFMEKRLWLQRGLVFRGVLVIGTY